MASHTPILAVRPNEQFSTDVKTRDFASSSSNATTTSSHRRKRSSTTKSAVSKASSVATETANKVESAVKQTPGHMAHAVKVPHALRFPLIVVSSLTLRLVLYSVVSGWAGLELASVSRELRQEWQVAAVLGWKVLELSGAWWAEYDWLDLASLSLLSNLPYYFLLDTFYSLPTLPIWTSLSIDIVSLTLPFLALGSRVKTTSDASLQRPAARSVSHDYQILALTAFLAAAVFALTLYASFTTWLPLHIVRHFDNVRTLDIAHESTIISLATLFVPAGFAAMRFLFVPTVSASNRLLTALDPIAKDSPFDPESSTLAQTVSYNLGLGKEGLSPKNEVLFKRTAVLALSSAINTFVRVYGTVDGTEISGAFGWSGLWAAAVVTVGFVYQWVAE